MNIFLFLFGFIIGRYITTMIDSSIEVFNGIIISKTTDLDIETKRKQIEFNKKYANTETHVVGFDYPEEDEGYIEDEFDEEDE